MPSTIKQNHAKCHACEKPCKTSYSFGPYMAEEACALPAGRRAPADQAGQGLLPRQVLRVPGPRAGIIRGRRRSGRTRATSTETGLAAGEWAGPRHPAHLTEEQVAQRVRQQVRTRRPHPQLLDKTYFLDPGTVVTAPQEGRAAVKDKPLCAARALPALPLAASRILCAKRWPL